jgi:anaerobic ribonucleoside-triphosphate reductase activating protein
MVNEYNDPGCRRRSSLNLSGYLLHSTVNGPGTRAVVWVQGCPLRCKGCFNKASWPFSPAHIVPAEELAARILAADGIEGVTFSGGEPFTQAGPLADVAERVIRAGLTVVTYSGYTFEQLASCRDPEYGRLLRATDLLIAGPYREDLACRDRYRGSANQEVIPLTGRIVPEAVNCENAGEHAVEFTIAPDGTVTTTGFPPERMVKQMATQCRGV